MRKLLLPLLFGALCTACIDKDYDLSKIDTDDITIGDVQRFPLATIKISLNEFSTNGMNIKALFDDAKIWLPTPLPDNAAYFDLARAKTEASYLNDIINALVVQMKSDADKLNNVAKLGCRKYKNQFIAAMEISQNVSDTEFINYFKSLFPTQPRLQAETKAIASNYLKTLTVKDLKYDIGNIEISSDVVKMLTGNLDSGGTLHLYGSIRSLLPVSMHLMPNFQSTSVSFSVDVDATKTQNSITEQQLTKEDLEQIVDGVSILIPVDLLKYYPDIQFQDTNKEQVVLSLHLIKRGGLSLNL